MKKSVVLMSLFTATLFAGCTKDNVVKENTIPITEDGTAYIAVKIASAPGTRGTDGNFEYGSADEHAVTSADFYFYDAVGAYVAKAQVWNDGTPNTGDPAENIEFKGNTVVMLKGLTEKTFPKYVVTVLNQPAGFTPGATLKGMEDQLVNGIKSGDNFIMTTTSYSHTTNYVGDQPVYFANEVVESNFIKDPSATITNPVVIYVERLAAKVSLGTSLTPVAGEANTYEVKATLAGDPNSGTEIGAENVRVRFDSWGLNSTAKQSHIVKNIDCDWSLGNFAWNESANFRSLWGKGPAYGQAYDANDTYGTYLNYNKLSDMTVPFDENVYCAENTNTADKLTGHIGTAVTSAVISATLLHKVGESWVAGDFIRYSGLLYETDAFKAYVLNNLSTVGKLNYYRKTIAGETTTYDRISVNDIEVALNNAGDNSKVTLALTGTAKAGVWYTTKDGTDTAADINLLAADLKTFVGSGYKGGKMYYNIPIEHLYESTEFEEGNYGVVRNHHYKLTVNKLEKIGTGVWNPDSGELPINPENPEDEEYYQVGVQINILSWRIVNQDVEL